MATQQGLRIGWNVRALVLPLVLGAVVSGRGQDVPQENKKTDAPGGQRIEQLKQAAKMYRIARESEPAKSFVLIDEPVLRWTNPLRKTDDGAVFLWTEQGRPEAIASFYRYRSDEGLLEDHEFQSLATTPLATTRDGQPVWTPQLGGVEFSPIPGAPRPGATAAERLRQMQALAREFSTFFDLPEDKAKLRLLTKPLYRYDLNRADLLDGALFAFVQTTDPEALLLIEARPVAKDPVWQYAFARMSMVNLRGQHKDQTVWTVDWAQQGGPPIKPYITLRAPESPR